MARSKVTGPKAASSASKTLTNKKTGSKYKTAAGSALSQTKAPKKTTSNKAASAASKVLKDGRTSKASDNGWDNESNKGICGLGGASQEKPP